MAAQMANIEALKGVYEGLKARMEKTVEDFRGNLASIPHGPRLCPHAGPDSRGAVRLGGCAVDGGNAEGAGSRSC